MTQAPVTSNGAPALRATYRFQFHRDFTFADAEALVPYLADLGISHLYASPITMAVPGSTHGYDVTDPTRLNPELGGEDRLERLSRALAGHGMGLIIDIVPNHMAASTRNPHWMEMLEFGPASPKARLFDVIWESGRLLLPVLGTPLQEAVDTGALSLRLDADAGRIVAVAYGDHAFPLCPDSVAQLLDAATAREPSLGAIAATYRSLVTEADAIGIGRAEEARRRLSRLDDAGRAALEAALAEADLSAVLDAQHWRLAWWRTASHSLNYRRFFNITELAGVRIEDEGVFEFVHRLPLDLIRRGLVHGLRVDHIDGLVDPAGYCERLREAVGAGVPIFVEKILEPGERLRSWTVDGTTGYERLNDINGLFVDPEAYRAIEDDLRRRHILTGTLASRLAAAKRQVLETSLRAEADLLARLARDGLDDAMAAGDLTEAAIRQAVVAMIVHCPVYRSYATDEGFTEDDVAVWTAIRSAVEANEDPLTASAVALLIGRLERPETASDREFRSRFQQLSGPAMAKGFEDTELYRVPVLLSVNEVGGSLEHPARTREELHDLAARRAAGGARDLVPLATHDTKRGPDTRARLDALGLVPERWLAFLTEQEPLLARLARRQDGVDRPDAIDRLLIVQTLLSTWPVSRERIDAYLEKALREAKRHTNWETPDEAYEQAAREFAAALTTAPEGEPFRAALVDLIEALAPAARLIGLQQVVLQHTLPGTPDIYQGTEFRDFSLVDPDNRRPVDWGLRKAALEAADDAGAGLDPADAEKFALTRSLLGLRRETPCLVRGGYAPLDVEEDGWRWFAFERTADDQTVRVIVPTRFAELGRGASADVEAAFSEPWQGEWIALDGRPLKREGRRLILSRSRPFVVARKA
ncbi:maltooligosyl trehalose synthase [Pseudoxanthobacter soli DSM 19599]|uniref:Maltooligosyl trehalose synthase n=1 Tax=Pseudoxanthobacter soli DSM 19599 TaxID=1123029 RepID=A0A1M7ZNE6_9HYPH|nr:malto-oligosyltrehalose synthase [Pseudoxanthobacter soli]SHO66428.1 maltooligosyl trehalose synthase [Pseudoxanthobacter soli DSM 19599]